MEDPTYVDGYSHQSWDDEKFQKIMDKLNKAEKELNNKNKDEQEDVR